MCCRRCTESMSLWDTYTFIYFILSKCLICMQSSVRGIFQQQKYIMLCSLTLWKRRQLYSPVNIQGISSYDLERRIHLFLTQYRSCSRMKLIHCKPTWLWSLCQKHRPTNKRQQLKSFIMLCCQIWLPWLLRSKKGKDKTDTNVQKNLKWDRSPFF